ncbi:hypothetical protein GTQ34_09670 [Muricauda sp. JGD-17]|uniref:Alpha/beta hydrolase n=1 Tax=Flagellimonas ochracea TaxID=2696472 RepID=A0A964TC67_9FLAO|nr:alpha/beta hydrolase-fold protein [Allomuricauda ochracea]NAY92187.1 hypothetical protein [Allomuricauda ochracea]
MKCLVVILLTLGLPFQQIVNGQSNREVTLPLTELIQMESKYGQEYEIYLSLPPEYHTSEDAFPVVYLLDGDLSFGLAYNTRILMAFGGEIPPMILVGISYSEDFKNIHGNRFRDFTPTKWPAQKIFEVTGTKDIDESGGADQFLDFLVNDIKQSITENYRVDTNSETLVGLSLSGLFVTHVVMKHPASFDNYLISSPSLWWYNGQLPTIENMEFKENQNPISIYTAIGSEEPFRAMVLNWVEFTNYFNKTNPEGIDFVSEVLYGETHVTTFNRALPRGLQVLFKNYRK